MNLTLKLREGGYQKTYLVSTRQPDRRSVTKEAAPPLLIRIRRGEGRNFLAKEVYTVIIPVKPSVAKAKGGKY